MFLSEALDQTVKKLKAHAANFVTLLNLSLGGFAIVSVLHNQPHQALLFIFIAALTDRFDGMVARKLNVESDLGKQLDSMSDIVSFGVAPAVLMYYAALQSLGVVGAFFMIFYIGCGAYRLARFNITDNAGYFTGLPITAAGCLVTLSYLAIPHVPVGIILTTMILMSLLMVSPFTIKKV
ncbi:CDP-diacylglycerol--serine O-phosphatidyltransferase [Rossellomorea marisflavi]|uniref:CDP-diacylglycerol--serine O-phosphatidyltransferase n=1 Tax=Rossellomorea marisflavi TaxID=189381 RepID=UPI0006FECAC5|nr:CDP-diacylglycerol--serine O-phosphatidyltransferase [Rossellomorea marisflavi]KQU59509.1 phosphatidylserine synthase [Bacillus sp. Leaf406]MDR4936202.1 CDP-diacylglycerol--serine O-phosphatidyltransferase [Rossellomorea marisflavi]UKS64116.1 CDP-diacylglycerol--serine O-phosphatidyltransferase [Rossellomorea marisflavi]UTE74295.1 CDP-diacylglycerol--serine O-phosphatidyltransferase [Rossellomorea marisflavi]WJV20258.1 CDP-diacylglycerol--serine O-phosphatidyltransferase [Rossellomorea mari